jgi:O-antigen ligase
LIESTTDYTYKTRLNREVDIVFGKYRDISLRVLFFQIGIMIILFEHIFEAYYHSLAFTPFTTRSIIGVHMWPSQVWFIFLGTFVMFSDILRNKFVLPRKMLNNSLPIFTIIGVYFVWGIAGFLNGNTGAMDLFREMVFPALAFPAILYLSLNVNLTNLFDRLIILSLILYPFLGINTFVVKLTRIFPGTDMGLLMLGSFVYSYFLYKSVQKPWYLVPALLIISPVVLLFSKPMLALMFMIPVLIAFISILVTQKKLKYSINKRTIKIGSAAILIFITSVIGAFYLNILMDGRIELLLRQNFIKEMVGDRGESNFGDLSGGRMLIWGNAIDLWKESPIFGHGLGIAVPSRGFDVIYQIHNYYLQALMNTGLIGFLLISSAWIIWFRRVFKSLKTLDWNKEKTIYCALLTYIFAYFFYALYGLPMVFSSAAYFFWIAVAFLSLLNKPVNNPEPS